jgi:hypothetical protein
LWAWEKPKLVGSVKISNVLADKTTGLIQTNIGNSSQLVYSISINPSDNTQIAVTGNGIIKILKLQEGTLKTLPIQKLEQKV